MVIQDPSAQNLSGQSGEADNYPTPQPLEQIGGAAYPHHESAAGPSTAAQEAGPDEETQEISVPIPQIPAAPNPGAGDEEIDQILARAR